MFGRLDLGGHWAELHQLEAGVLVCRLLRHLRRPVSTMSATRDNRPETNVGGAEPRH
jgi:hypothetical protein